MHEKSCQIRRSAPCTMGQEGWWGALLQMQGGTPAPSDPCTRKWRKEGGVCVLHKAHRLSSFHAKNNIARRIIPFVLGLWDKNTEICAGAMPGFSGHYQDLGTSTLNGYDPAGNLVLSVGIGVSDRGIFDQDWDDDVKAAWFLPTLRMQLTAWNLPIRSTKILG